MIATYSINISSTHLIMCLIRCVLEIIIYKKLMVLRAFIDFGMQIVWIKDIRIIVEMKVIYLNIEILHTNLNKKEHLYEK